MFMNKKIGLFSLDMDLIKTMTICVQRELVEHDTWPCAFASN